jgi:hypothetical protein
VGAPEVDLVAVWFAGAHGAFGVSWQVADAAHRLQPGEVLLFTASCMRGADALNFEAVIASQGAVGTLTLTRTDGANEALPATLSVDGDVVSINAGVGGIASGTCTDTHATSTVLLHHSGHWGGRDEIVWRDAAPDAGFGKDAEVA